MNDEHGAGSVYFVRRIDGIIKIGRTRNVEKRVKELNRYGPARTWTFIHGIATNMATILEHALHQRFAEFHLTPVT